MNLKRTLKKKKIYSNIEKRQMNCHFKFIKRNKNTEKNMQITKMLLNVKDR